MSKPKRVIDASTYSMQQLEKQIVVLEQTVDIDGLRAELEDARGLIEEMRCRCKEDRSLMVDTIYPIGSIMMRHDSQNPKTLTGFNHTIWSQLASDTYIRTASSAGSTGGSTTTDGTAITTAQMPSHSHSWSGTVASGGASHTHSWTGTTVSGGTHSHSVPGKKAGVAGGRIYNSSGTQLFDPAVFIGACHHAYGGTGSDSIWIGHYNCSPGGTRYDDDFYLGTETHATDAHSGHTHTISGTTGATTASHAHTVSGTVGSNGSGTSHAHTFSPPYITLVVWRRVE